MKNLFTMLSLAAILILPAAPMLDAGKTVPADAGTTIIAKGKSFEGPRGFKDVPKPPGWSKPEKSAQLEVLPAGMLLAKGFDNVPVDQGKPWSGKDKPWSGK